MFKKNNSQKKQGKLYVVGKVLFAGTVAFLILNLFAYFYYNIPSRVASFNCSTDFARVANDSYFKMTEGFGYGKTDEMGFNNVCVIENPDILIVGSSQLEGYNVKTEENMTAILNTMLEENDFHLKAYNIGVSGHNFGVCLNNLSEAYEEFKPRKYVVIETTDVLLEDEQLDKIQNGTYQRDDVVPSGSLALLQKFDYFRLLYLKLSEMRAKNMDSAEDIPMEEELREEYLHKLGNSLKTAAEEIGDCRLIIISSAPISLCEDGIQERMDKSKIKMFKQVCMENEVVYLDTEQVQ